VGLTSTDGFGDTMWMYVFSGYLQYRTYLTSGSISANNRRLALAFVPYWMNLLLSAVVGRRPQNLWDATTLILGQQFWFSGGAHYDELWWMTAFFDFLLLLPVLVHVKGKLQSHTSLTTGVMYLLCLAVWFCSAEYMHWPNVNDSEVRPHVGILYCILGASLFELKKQSGDAILNEYFSPSLNVTFLNISICSILFWGIMWKFNIDVTPYGSFSELKQLDEPLHMAWYLQASMIVIRAFQLGSMCLFIFVVTSCRDGFVLRLLSFPPLVWVGERSLTLYLIHWPIRLLYHQVWQMLGDPSGELFAECIILFLFNMSLLDPVGNLLAQTSVIVMKFMRVAETR